MILSKYFDSDVSLRIENVFKNVKSKIHFKSIIFIILSFLLANQTFIGSISPFIFVLLGVASVFNVPLILVLVSSVISLAIQDIQAIMLAKLLSFFIAFTLLTALVNIEGISRKYSVFIKFIISFIGIDFIFNIINGTFFTDIFQNVGNILIVSILYFIFVAGLYVILNARKGYVFAKEESISMVIVLAMALTCFSNLSLFGYSIVNILILILILVYGWKNGAVSACSAGLIVGLLLTCIMDVSMSYVVALSFSGLIAGVFSKLGKVAIVIAFIVGNIYISYYTSNFSELSMRISEILVASLALLFIPKNLEKKIGNLFNKNRTLDGAYENILDSATNLQDKIGAISDVFDSLSDITLELTKEDEKETRNVIKSYILNYVENSCIDCNKRKECVNDEKLNIMVDYIANKLENNEKIDKSMLLYECEFSDKIIEDINEIYNNMKIMRVLKQKEKENKDKLSRQYKEVSKILNNVSKSIKNPPAVCDETQKKLRDELKFYGYIVYEDDFKKDDKNIEYTFVTDILTNIDKQKKQIIELASNILEQSMTIKLILNSSKKEKSKIKLVSIPEYEVEVSLLHETKSGEDISGDSYLLVELEDLKQVNVLSDGAGSGKMAAKGSQTVINILEKLLNSGFDEKKAVEIINSVIKIKENDTSYSTLDAFIFNLKNAEAEFIKLGAAPTYVLQDGKITTISNLNIPLGLLKDTDYLPITKKLHDGAIVLQITDGIVNENLDKTNNYITNYLQNLDITKSAKQITDELHRVIIKENKNLLNDDMTAVVTKIKKTRK